MIARAIVALLARADDYQQNGPGPIPRAVWFRDGYDLVALWSNVHPLRFGLGIEVEHQVAESPTGFDDLALTVTIGPLSLSLAVQRPRGGWWAHARSWSP